MSRTSIDTDHGYADFRRAKNEQMSMATRLSYSIGIDVDVDVYVDVYVEVYVEVYDITVCSQTAVTLSITHNATNFIHDGFSTLATK